MANVPDFGIVEQSESKLVFKNKPGKAFCIFLTLFALFFGGVPFGVLVLISSMFGVTTFSCQRIQPSLVNCVWSKSQYLGFIQTVSNQPIQKITDVKIQSASWSNGQGGGTAKIWLSLTTKSGQVKLFEQEYAIESGFKPTFQPEAEQKIKALLTSQASVFTIEEDTRLSQGFWGAPVVFLPLTLIAALIVYGCVRSQTITLDKAHNLYNCKIHTLLGTRTKIHALDEIQSIDVTNYRGEDDVWYQLTIVFQSGKKYKLPGVKNYTEVHDVSDEFQKFLGLSS